uniref:FAS-associated factor 1-like n=1 Tax=Styela clava TaxID=7725 RepID=UPI001939F443|nr:FAS-associated factor 1-like [Styela clava]
MDRNEILANFQACTGIEDISQCIAHLEQCDWNMNEAVNVALAASSSPSPQQPVTEDFSSQNFFTDFGIVSEPSTSKPRMIHFEVRLNDTTRHVSLDESANLGTLRDVASMELQIPKNEARFDGWPQSGTDIMSDSTALGSLHLPLNVTLTVRSSAFHNGAAFGLSDKVGTSQDFAVPCAAFKDDFDKLKETYMLEITDIRTKSIYSLNFLGSKTFQDLTFDAHSLTGIPPSKQVWNTLASDKSLLTPDRTLGSLGLNLPKHRCSITETKATSTTFVDLTADEDNMEVDEYEEASENLDDEFLLDVPTVTRLRPLMPEEATDDIGALAQFQSEFNSRYGQEAHVTPSFLIDTLDAAIQEAFGGSARNRRLLAVYLHHDKSIQSNVFCSQLLCAPSVVEYMANHCVIWAWDVTSDFNRKRMLDMCTRMLGSGVADTVKRVPKDGFPMLVLAQGRGRSCDVNSIVQGNTSLDELMVKLIKAVEDAEAQKQEDIRMEELSEARERIKREQEEAYDASLQQDKEKQIKLDAERAQLEKQKQEEERKEQEKNEQIERLGEIVPQEPSPDCGFPVAKIRFRPPGGGDMVTRTFLASESLQGLLNFVGSLGYLNDKYRVITSYPKRDISSLDPKVSLKDHKLFPQETLIIEERIE